MQQEDCTCEDVRVLTTVDRGAADETVGRELPYRKGCLTTPVDVGCVLQVQCVPLSIGSSQRLRVWPLQLRVNDDHFNWQDIHRAIAALAIL